MGPIMFTRCFRCMEEMGSSPVCPHCGYDHSGEAPQSLALPAGTILGGKYVLGLPFSQGELGITYIGWDLAAGRKVAIKEYFPSGQAGRSQERGRTELIWHSTEVAGFARQEGKDAFLREAGKLEKVSQIPQVANVLETFEENATAYVAMEYIPGESLRQRVERTGPMLWNEAREIFLTAADAMARVHREGLIHGNLSPDDLILQPDGKIRILDLGIVKELGAGAPGVPVARNRFSPPERYTQQGGYGPWTDVYALAASLYYAITGMLPPSAPDRLTEDTLQWGLPQIAALPENVTMAIQRAMVLFRNNRTQTMEEFMADLRQSQTPEEPKEAPKEQKAAQSVPSPEPVSVPSPAPKAHRKPARKLPLWRKVVILVAAVAAVLSALIFAVEGIRTGSTGSVSSGPSWYEKTGEMYDEETRELMAAGTGDTHTYENGAKAELYFNSKDQERCRVFWDGNGKQMYVSVAEYDKAGNMMEHRVCDENDKLMWRDTWKYNKNGDVTEEYLYDADNRLQRSTVLTYDRKNRIVSRVEKNSSGVVTFEATYTYDGDGNRTMHNTDGTSAVAYFDGDGNAIKIVSLDAQGNMVRYWEYAYNSNGQETMRVSYENGEKSYQLTSVYEGDLLTKETFESFGEYPITQVTLYTYGVRDVCFSITDIVSGKRYREKMDSITGMPLCEYSTTDHESYDVTYYNRFGYSIYNEYRDSSGNPMSIYEYFYDRDGERTGSATTSYNWDGSGYTVTQYDADYQEISTQEYDANGKLIS